MLVSVIPVGAGCLAHTGQLTVPLGDCEASRESANIILGQLVICHFFQVLVPELFVVWQHRWTVSSWRRTLTQPGRGVVILDEQLLLPRLPLRRPLRPHQRLVTLHAVGKDFIEDWSYGLLVDQWQVTAPARTG